MLGSSGFWVQNHLTIRKASMVTSQKEQIQSLIADIERVLGAGKPRTPWIKASEIEPQRQALERAQNYLASLQQLFEAPGGWGPVDPTTGQLEARDDSLANQVPKRSSLSAASAETVGQSVKGQSADDSAEDLLQALRTEMKFLKSSALQPLRREIDSLQSTREVLQAEVEALEEQRSQVSQALAERTNAIQSNDDPAHEERAQIGEEQLNQFLAVLMERLQENLSVQVTQTLDQLESDHAAAIAAISAASESERLALQPSREQQIEEMRQLQSRSDQLLVNIDSTLQRMFETLQSNINSYQISLNEGIENMHSLGRQGEVIVRSLVDHLTTQLGQTTPPEPAFFSPRDASALPIADLDDLGLDDLIDEMAADQQTEEVSPSEPVLEPESATETDSDLEEFGLEEITQAEAHEAEGTSQEDSGDSSTFSEATVLEAASPDQDTVSSLDEILPEESLLAVAADVSGSEEVSARDVLAAEETAAEGTAAEETAAEETAAEETALQTDQYSEPETIAEVEPATFIREDGTIDVDLLKLDIDRSSEDDELTPDEIVVDAAIADAQTAKTEAEDPDIEAKVTPTADAVFLAELTIDDLTVDDSTIDELTVETPTVEAADDATEASDTGPEIYSTEIYSIRAQVEIEIDEGEFEETENDVALSAVLPDLGPPMAPVHIPAAPLLAEVEETVSEETVSEDAASVEGIDTERESYLESDGVLEADTEAGSFEAAGVEDGLELPVALDFSDIDHERQNQEHQDQEHQNQERRDQALQNDSLMQQSFEAGLSESLLDTLEENNQASIRNALEMPGGGTDELISDLEEPTVSNLADAAFARSAMAATTEPLESALIPDQPADEPAEETDELIDEIDEPTGEFNDPIETLDNAEAPYHEGSESEIDSYFESRDLEEAYDNAYEESVRRENGGENAPEERALEEDREATEIENQPEVLESALTPDLPETEGEMPDVLTDEEINTAPSDELRNALEEDNQTSIRNAVETPAVGVDEVVSDLEEPIVSDLDDDVLASRAALPIDTEPPESALIPDEPIDGVDHSDVDEPAPDEPATDEPVLIDDSAEASSVEESLEDLFIEDYSTEASIENLPPTGVENLIADDTELLETLGQPDVDSSMPVLDSELDFSQMDQPRVQPVDEQSAGEPEYLVDSQPSEGLLADVVSDGSEDGFSADDQRTDDFSDPSNLSSVAPMAATGLLVEPATPADQSDESNQLLAESNQDSLEPTSAEADSAEATVLQPIADEGDAFDDSDQPADWFLGIDLGTTGLSAVLMERRTHRMYELCWSVTGDSEASRFRLPTVASIDRQGTTRQLGIDVVGPAALQIEDAPLMRSLKPMVKAGIPDDFSGEPWMQWSDQMSLPLIALQTAIADLLRTLSGSAMSCHAVGLKDAVLRRALTELQGVIIGYPTNWPDTYSFNVREAVLSAGLVGAPDQVFFVEDAIAALLSALPAPGVDVSADNQQPGLYNCSWVGGTVVVSAGATLTEVAIADLPKNLTQLSYSDFVSRSYTYAGDSVDQDIICQLLHTPTQAEKSAQAEGDEVKTSPHSSAEDWESLGLDQLKLPRPGEADRIIRHRLRQRLNDSALGRQALAAAQDLKMMLQEDEEVDVQLGDRTWIITRKDLEAKVFIPYIQRLNRLTSALLNQKFSAQSIKQVICTGGAASLGVISDWLRQKFPNATIIQDTYSGEYSNSCSRVAYGLANLCHYPNVLDINRHRYNDYFLLLELLRTLPEQPLPAGGIMHLLSQRGVDVQACQTHLLALIEGHLPPGLIPTEGDRPLISAQSSDIENYRLLSELPLFRKQGGQIYIADLEQGERLRTHLESLLTTKAQSLNKPMTTHAIEAIDERATYA